MAASMVLQLSIAFATLGILFLLVPRVMAIVFGALALWLALTAWFETWGEARN